MEELLKQVMTLVSSGRQESQTIYVHQPDMEPQTESNRVWFAAGAIAAGAICVGLFGLALCAFTEKE